jgi:hypothetical protein
MSEYKRIVPPWVLLGIAVFCFAAVGDLPYGYYRLLRWIACPVAIASAIQLNSSGRSAWVWIFGLVALLFNPLFPFHFDKATWRIFDAAGGISFLIGSLFVYKDRKKANKTVEATPLRSVPHL